VIAEELGLTLEKTTLKDLGRAKRVEIGKEETHDSSTAPVSTRRSRRG